MKEQRPYLDETWLETEYVIKGRTLRDIAGDYDKTFQQIGQLVKRFKLTEKRNALRKPYMNKEWLAGELNKRKTQQEIGSECGVYRATVGTWVHRYKLKRRFFTKEERVQRSVASQKRLYATDSEYRRIKIERASRWQQQNPERANKHSRDYYKRQKMIKGGTA